MCELCLACGMSDDACVNDKWDDKSIGLNQPETEASLADPQGASSQGIPSFQASFEGNHQNNMLALVAGTMWNSTALTYSFPDATSDYTGSPSSYGSSELTNNFSQLLSDQQDAARLAFDMIASYTNLTLTEITGAQGSADIRMARSNAPSTAWAYYPGSNEGGDAWLNNTSGYYNAPYIGTYAFHTISHEIGHALGLKHGHSSSGYGALSSNYDQMAYSLMTYKSHEGSSGGFYTNEYYGYAQTYMAYDIAALQAIYGVNWSHNDTDNTYTWSSTTGEMSIDGAGQGAAGSNRIFSTLWDGGGDDTIDLSNLQNAIIGDLKPGNFLSFSSIQKAQLAGGIWADGNVYFALSPDDADEGYIENLIAGRGDDVMRGNRVANTIEGRGGRDEIRGEDGDDYLLGNGGKDVLVGGAGNDRLEGGIGSDKLKGNGGADVFVLDDRTGRDVARDFELGVDFVDVPDVALATLTVSNTGHLTVDYMGDWMILRGLLPGDAMIGDLVI